MPRFEWQFDQVLQYYPLLIAGFVNTLEQGVTAPVRQILPNVPIPNIPLPNIFGR